MERFVVLVHVLAAVLLIGPLVLAGFVGRRAIRKNDADEARQAFVAGRWATAGSIVVALFGALAVAVSSRYTFATPWVIISSTLFVVLLGVSAGYTVPALRKAARLLQQRSAVAALDEPDGVERERLSALGDRLAGAAGLSFVIVCVIVVLMVYRPFGS
ncbi:DUF2269 family protein [Dactylosporangium sp. AC04546]|uniref:DUF2269 family protein n=1 Tax=Dactylosporangium sp. AC04546 TaxID=2862460 RepID=UPI001EDC9DFE|nr:DUF2269 family protein [Dactylosporangium sp. AC04546]WVK80041.1 DUF2269 family protein [Dactylosporangium sp. AC04546]